MGIILKIVKVMLTGLRGADGQVRCKDQSQDHVFHVLELQLLQGQEPN